MHNLKLSTKHVTEHCINTNVVSSIVVSVEAEWVNGINDWFVPLSLDKCDTRGSANNIAYNGHCVYDVESANTNLTTKNSNFLKTKRARAYEN